MVVALPLAAVSVYRFYEDWRFAREAQSTQGMVLTKEIKRSAKGGQTKRYEATYPRNLKVGDETQWRFEYEYRDYQGRRMTGQTDIGASEAERWKVGATGRVLYDRAKPSNAIWIG